MTKNSTNKFDVSWLPIIVFLLVVIVQNIVRPVWLGMPFYSIIGWDTFAYYIYLPSAFIYGDFLQLEYIPQIMEQYKLSGYFYQAHKIPNGNYVMSFTMGMAILLTPFFFIGHFLAYILGYPMDGFSTPYVFAVYLGGISYATLGLYMIRKVLKEYFSDWVIAIALLILVLCTNFHHYAIFEVAMTHMPVFTLFTILIYSTLKWHQDQKWKYVIGIGVSIGLMGLIRPTELIGVLIPLFWGVWSFDSLKAKLQLIKDNWQQLIGVIMVCFLIGLPQFLYWKWASGNWLYYSYDNAHLDFFNAKIHDGLFSIRKGWLVYTPIMTLALIGIIPMVFKIPKISWSVILYVSINIWIVFSWSVWWYGGSFGCRPLVPSYAILMIPLAAFLSLKIWKNSITKLILGVGIIATMGLNQLQNWQYNQYMFSTEGMSDYVYDLLWLKTKVDRQTIRDFENATTFDKSKIKNKKLIKSINFESPQDSTYNRSIDVFSDGQYAAIVDKDHSLTMLDTTASALNKDAKKYAVSVEFKAWFKDYEWDYRLFSRINFEYRKANDHALFGEDILLPNLIGPEKIENPNSLYGQNQYWGTIRIDRVIPIEKLKDTDKLVLYINGFTHNKVYIDEVKIYLLEL